MSVESFIFFYEDAQYSRSFLETLKSFRHGANSETLVYIIKNIITRDGFFVKDKKQMKLLILYYFYLLGEVSFTNDYKITFHKEKLSINITSLSQINTRGLYDFKQFFDLGKNEVFLNKIIDTTRSDAHLYVHPETIKVSTFLDFFIVFLHENFELYSLSGEHFPLFKWLINEVQEDKNH